MSKYRVRQHVRRRADGTEVTVAAYDVADVSVPVFTGGQCKSCGRWVDEGEQMHMIAVVGEGYRKVCGDCARDD